MKKDKTKVNAAVQYFKLDSVYQKLFKDFKKKYESLGRVAGTVSLSTYSEEEKAVLAEFLGLRKDKLSEKNKVSLVQFEKQLSTYRYGDIDLHELLETYFNQVIMSNKQRAQNKLNEKDTFFSHLKNSYTSINEWVDYIDSKPINSYWIHRLIDESFERFENYAKLLNKSIESLPEKPVRLPVLAQQMTSNPHAFDRNEMLGRLLIHLLAFKLGEEQNVPNTSEEISELLFSYNILRDDITNFVTVANLLARTDSPKDDLWHAASKTNSVLNIPIRELLYVRSLYPNTTKKEVWVVENSGIFSSLLDEVPSIPLICTHGQFKLAAWKTFDLLIESNCTLHYASDLDPEGLGMAYRLLNRYPQHAKLWKMDTPSYRKSLSKNETLSEARLNQLLSIDHPQLQDVKNEMMREKFPGYQEALLDEMVVELKKEMEAI
ncbi:TIGR02679 family protein [Alkalibacterium sp. MB6]|uniref:TIGR02679 family protein n=1 Tax=Alkalibacterium sp. MB6 TaxID=2081965 RepID=UPI00137AFA6F|nr:TIGR02679 family protein [Alkalibacterium sp. MB6]